MRFMDAGDLCILRKACYSVYPSKSTKRKLISQRVIMFEAVEVNRVQELQTHEHMLPVGCDLAGRRRGMHSK
jgi:hypothetical protein